jgi:hypothetical protein
LDELVGGRDGELAGQFERLSARFDELAELHGQAGSRLEAIAAAQEAGADAESGGELEEIRGQFERLSVRLDGLIGGRDEELAGRLEGLSARFDEVTVLHERTETRLDAIAAAQESLVARGSTAELDELMGVVAGLEATVAGRDREVVGRFERLSVRLDELVDRRDGELTGQLEGLSARLDELAVAGQTEALVERITSLAEAQRRGEEVLVRLVGEVAALHEQKRAILDPTVETPAATPDSVPGSPDAPHKKTNKKNKSKKK